MIQKLNSIEIVNFKNVQYGKISFRDGEKFLNVTGIYGQNGSGKTTTIDCLNIIKNLFLGYGFADDIAGMISSESPAEIAIETENLKSRIQSYKIQFRKNDMNEIEIIHESISSRILEKNKRSKNLISYDVDNKSVFKFNQVGKKLASEDALTLLKENCRANKSSLLFSTGLDSLLNNKNAFEEQKVVLENFVIFANNLRLYTSEYGGLISANIITPVGVNYKLEKDRVEIVPMQLGQDQFVAIKFLEVYEKVVEQMNNILPKIIPNLEIGFMERERRLSKNSDEEVRIEFIAKRNGKEFSLVYESDGIKKIIGLIGYIIEVYNNPNIIAAIDEFDAGIFEFLLGELLEIVSTGAEGLLIFTSHNLRVLELVDSKKVVFSTTNPANRYIKLQGIKSTNNLRDVYINNIQLGNEQEELYSGNSQTSLRMALLKAGVEIE